MTNAITERVQRRIARALRGVSDGPLPVTGDGRVEPADEVALRELLKDRLYDHNMRATEVRDVAQLAYRIRDARGEVVAGVTGWTWGGTCYLDLLWVAESTRGRGLGTQLMAQVERLARARHCHQIALETYSFQAPGFYALLGFETVGELTDYPSGHNLVYLRKSL